MSEAQATSGKGRRQFVVIMVIALLTLGGSYLVFYLANAQGVWGTTNNGAFVDPPLTQAELGWQSDEAGRHWWLWVMAADGCSGVCQQKVTDLRALHILLNREASRVRRGITGFPNALGELPEPFPKLVRVSIQRPPPMGPGVYVIDPNGNFVFRYGLDVDPKLILQDLKKLLKVSQIG